MYLKILCDFDSIYNKAIKYFPLDYVETLKSKESIVSRYLISKEVENTYKIINYLPKIDYHKIPKFDNNIFWSISHKDNLVFVWVSKNMIWIDIEIYKERDSAVLDKFSIEEYELLWWKNWINFYILWTAKESIIKFNLLMLDDMSNIKLIKVQENISDFSKITFAKELLFNNKNNINQVKFWFKGDIFYSVCSNNMIK